MVFIFHDLLFEVIGLGICDKLNTCRWLTLSSTQLCGKNCRGEFCKILLAGMALTQNLVRAAGWGSRIRKRYLSLAGIELRGCVVPEKDGDSHEEFLLLAARLKFQFKNCVKKTYHRHGTERYLANRGIRSM